MAAQDGGKSEVGVNSSPALKPKDWVLLSLRLVAFFATTAATIVMALNKQTNTVVVATVGNTPVKAAVTAKFQQTPAFVFFVVANGMASFHNCLMIVVELFGHKIDCNGLRLAIIAILDMMTVAMTSAGDGAATFMAEVGKNGNSHARWNKICDKFHAYCDRGNGALIASFIGLLILLIINVMSISKLLKPKHTTYIGVP
ncbi:CASP-like protein 1B2 [Juglans regia]|uniref:CASP-like protein n=2 Tax=Juglans regia TaxID=51240 RepID=A0A2I4FA46_JUGRE|nr:CASP-like protein 1B2 [Juglans regia]